MPTQTAKVRFSYRLGESPQGRGRRSSRSRWGWTLSPELRLFAHRHLDWPNSRPVSGFTLHLKC